MVGNPEDRFCHDVAHCVFAPTADRHLEKAKTQGNWENVEVMFTDDRTIEELSTTRTDETDSYIDPPGEIPFWN